MAASSEADAGDDRCLVSITYEPIDVTAAYGAVGDPGAGAIASFLGVTRDNFNGKAVDRLEYEGAEELAVAMMRRMAAAAHAAAAPRGGLKKVYMCHRLGVVPVGEASIAILVSSAHRGEALSAVSWLIDEVKATLPVWKKEWFADGSYAWKENSECCFGHRHQGTAAPGADSHTDGSGGSGSSSNAHAGGPGASISTQAHTHSHGH